MDASPLLGQRTGVGRYVAELLRALAARDRVAVRAVPFTVRGGRPDLPDGVAWRHVPASARLLRHAWTHLPFPPAELLAGRCDVFHATNFVLPPTARARGVLTVHDLAYLRYPDTVARASLAYRKLVAQGVRRAAVVVTPSRAVAGELAAEYGLETDRVQVTPLGVDPAWARARRPSVQQREQWGVPERYLLFVGTREPRKNLDSLAEAHRRARQVSGTDVLPLVLAGPAGWGPRVQADATITGFLPDHELRELVAGAAALVLPSRYEGFGLPVLEALAAGTPVICSDLPALREVGGPHCRYTPAGDVDALADALLAASVDEDTAEAARARREHAACFTWERCADATETAYRRAAHD